MSAIRLDSRAILLGVAMAFSLTATVEGQSRGTFAVSPQPNRPRKGVEVKPAPAPVKTDSRKPWKKKTPVEVVLEQADKLKAEIAEMEDEIKAKRRQLQKFEEAKKIFGSRIQLCANNYSCLEGADALLVVTEWQTFRSPNFERMKSMMSQPVIFDGRNIYDAEHLRELGFTYYGVGKK